MRSTPEEHDVAFDAVPADELQALNPSNKESLWPRNVLGMLLHVPDHWIALTPPLSSGSTALLCDSLDPAPFAFSADDVKVLLQFISEKQKNARLTVAGTWSCYRLSVNAGPMYKRFISAMECDS